MSEQWERRYSDAKNLSIGDWSEDIGDRIPGLEVEIRRSGGYTDHENALWKLADLTFLNAAVRISLEGLSPQDLRELAGFCAEYAARIEGNGGIEPDEAIE